MAKNTKNSSNDLGKEELLQKIKILKLQSIILILTTLAGFGSFFVEKYKLLKDIFSENPFITINSSEAYVSKNAQLIIYKRDSKYEVKHSDYILFEVSKGISLSEGNYHFKIVLDEDTIWQKSYALVANDRKNIELPSFNSGSITVKAALSNKKILPSSSLDLNILSSGNGYLWIFTTIDEGNTYSLIDLGENNEIKANEPFDFGESEIISNNSIGKESLLFIVTSLNDPTHAKNIQSIIVEKQDSNINKATIQQRKTMWGATKLDVIVTAL